MVIISRCLVYWQVFGILAGVWHTTLTIMQKLNILYILMVILHGVKITVAEDETGETKNVGIKKDTVDLVGL